MKKLFILPLLLSVMACSSGGGGSEGSITPGGSDDPDPNPTTDPVTDPTPVEEETLRIGRGFSDSFEQGQLDIAVDMLSAGGSTTISASLVNASGSAFSQDLAVTFSSTCISQGLSTVSSPVQSTNGRAQTTYVAQGCEGDDVVTATVISDGTSQQAMGVVTVAAAELGSINFVSADPDNIGLRGTGGAGRQETSTVVFRVRDQSGGAVRGQLVRFQLSTAVGGIELSAVAACSGADGTVQTVVQAGDVATVVRITARLIDNETRNADGSCNAASGNGDVITTTQSDELTITTGVPDFDSVTLVSETLNLEGLGANGGVFTNSTDVTVFLSDRFNNPVPAGTAVQFRTEGGSIGGQCSVGVAGSCTVPFRSQNPIPEEKGRSNRGRSTVMAFAIGEENFDDENGTGRFDSGDGFPVADDIPEAFVDHNENGQRDSTEPFIDFNEDMAYTTADGQQSSVLCDDVRCDYQDDGVTPQLLNVFQPVTIVLSGPAVQFLYYRSGNQPQFGQGSSVTPCNNGLAETTLQCGQSYLLLACDINDNIPPAETDISFIVDELELAGPLTSSVPNSNQFGGFFRSVTLKASGEGATGTLTVGAESPAGVETGGISIQATGCMEEEDEA